MHVTRPLARKSNIVIQKLKDETLIYDLRNDKAYCLNETSAFVWQLCNGKNSAQDIADEMSNQMKSLVGTNVVWLALDQLVNDGLLENGEELQNRFAGISRRAVVKKIGFGSLVALPVISAIVAPKAIYAQSCVGAGTLSPGTPLPLASTIPRANGGACHDYCISSQSTCCSGSASGGSETLAFNGGPCTCGPAYVCD